MSLDAPTDASAAVAAAPVVLARKVTAPWIGFLMIAGGLVTAVATFLPFEKVIYFVNGSVYGTYQLTGIGSSSQTGEQPAELSPGGAGKVVLAAALLAVVFGILTLRSKGRLWVGIVGLVSSLVGLVMGLASIAAAKSDQTDLNDAAPDGLTVHAITKIGAPLATVGIGIAALACILALVVRRRSA